MLKKFTTLTVLGLAVLFGVSPVFAQADQKQPPAAQKKGPPPPLPGAGTGGNTPHATISTAFGGSRTTGTLLTLTYGRPTAVHPRNGGEPRKIWGGLVKWDAADRLGADEATTLITPVALAFGSTTIPAGTYVLYIVPSENGTSKLGFSRHVSKWGIPVDEKNDVARIDLKKEPIQPRVEQLTIAIDDTSKPGGPLTGLIRIAWENLQFSAPFELKK